MSVSIFPVPAGPYAGMTRDQVVAARDRARDSLLALTTGTRVQAAGYTQGEGGRNVTYAGASEAQLRRTLNALNALLGCGSRRRAIGVMFK